MFCTNCGAEMADGQRFCSNCGAPAEQLPPPEPREEPASTPEEAPAREPGFSPERPPYIPPEEPGKPEKKKRGAKGWILGVLVAVLVAAAALAAIFWRSTSAYASNLVARSFSDPEEYYQRVEKNQVRVLLDSVEQGEGVFAAYQGAAETRALGREIFREEKLQLSFNESAVGDELLDLIEDELGMDVSWFRNVGFYLSAGTEDKLIGGSLTAFLNDRDIIAADFTLDTVTGMAYAKVPRLSGQALYYDLREAGFSPEELEAADELMAVLQDPELISTLVDRYSGIVIGDLTKVDKGTQELSAGGLSGKYTALEVKIDGKAALKIARDVLKKAQNDAEVKRVVCAWLKSQGLNEEQIEKRYDELLDQMENKYEELGKKDPSEIKNSILMTVYVDSLGRICGRDVKLREEKDVISEISCVLVRRGLNYGLRTEVFLDNGYSDCRDEKTLILDGGGKLSLKGEITGSFDLRYKTVSGSKGEEEKKDMKLCKFALEGTAQKDGLSYELSATPAKDLINEAIDGLGTLPAGAEDLIRGASAVLSGEIRGETSSAVLTLKNGKKELASLSAELYRVEEFAVSVPSAPVSAYEWAAGIDYSKLTDILKDLTEAGVPASAFGGVGDFF